MLTSRALEFLARQPGVRLAPSRCVLHRYRPAGCSRCFDSCPTGAIHWSDEGLKWHDAECRRCLLCVAACPTGALVARESPLVPQLRTLGQQERPVLACRSLPETRGHARIPCLGWLGDAELLLVAALALHPPLQLNLTRCNDCPNREILEPLTLARQTLDALNQQVLLIEEEARLDFREAEVSRRELFNLLRRRSREVAGSLADSLQGEPSSSYGDKRLPEKRFLLLQLLRKLPAARRDALSATLFPAITIDRGCCHGCTGCVGICPTGALLPPTRAGEAPGVHAQNCTECGLCTAFCPTGAIGIRSGKLAHGNRSQPMAGD